jgi:hypothetical protein
MCGLDLGPTYPEMIDIALGNLRFSAETVLTSLLATYTCIITSVSSICPFGHTSAYNRTLLYHAHNLQLNPL